MKLYLLSLGAGLLAGVLYGLLNVRSPAPPVVALVGLFGILIGEQAVPLAKRMLAADNGVFSNLSAVARSHVFGHLPGHGRRPLNTEVKSADLTPASSIDPGAKPNE